MDIYDEMGREQAEIKRTLAALTARIQREASERDDGVKLMSRLMKMLKEIKEDIEIELKDEEGQLFKLVDSTPP